MIKHFRLVGSVVLTMDHMWIWLLVHITFNKSPADKESEDSRHPSFFHRAFVSLVAEITKASAEYLKYLGDAEEDGDDRESVHGAEEDGLLKVFWDHALGHVEGFFQRAGITHEQRVDLRRQQDRCQRFWNT